jgi:hypothetical protein
VHQGKGRENQHRRLGGEAGHAAGIRVRFRDEVVHPEMSAGAIGERRAEERDPDKQMHRELLGPVARSHMRQIARDHAPENGEHERGEERDDQKLEAANQPVPSRREAP